MSESVDILPALPYMLSITGVQELGKGNDAGRLIEKKVAIAQLVLNSGKDVINSEQREALSSTAELLRKVSAKQMESVDSGVGNVASMAAITRGIKGNNALAGRMESLLETAVLRDTAGKKI